MTIPALHQLFLQFPRVSTDTRKIIKNCIFFALKGENFNGNRFAHKALQTGAAYVVIDEVVAEDSDKFIKVDDVLITLQQLATYHRNYCNAKVIALTGSNGKTTTKELINVVLKKQYKTIATVGNLNNHIGVPLTLLSIQKDTEIAVVEMGANHQKEIAFLCKLAQPDFGYITNFGKAHLEGFGGEEGVIKGKSELYDYLIAHEKHIFLNADDPIQEARLRSYIHKIGYSTQNHKYSIIQCVEANPFVVLDLGNLNVPTQLIGRYNFNNCAAAVLIGKYFNILPKDIKDAIADYMPQDNRSQLLNQNGHQIVLDAYNANPTSMQAALENFAVLSAQSKVAFLGDMFELGAAAAIEHQNIVNLTAELGFESVYLVGSNFYQTQSHFKKFKSFSDLKSYLSEYTLPKSTVLIKGSRGMALERIVSLL